MKEILFATLAMIAVAIGAAYGLDAMDWTASNKYSATSVRL